MAGTEAFIYGGITIGGSAPTYDTEILDHYMFVTNEDDCEFVVRFAVRVTPSGVPATDWTTLATRCLAIEAALRTRYQKLTVNWGASTQVLLDPDVNAGGATIENMGFSAEPKLDKVSDFPNSGEARAYEFRVRIGRPPNYTDAFGAAAGRRQVDVNFHYDTQDRLVVTLSGTWTQVPTKLARAQFLAQIDGVSGYAAYRLSLVNTANGGSSTAYTWTPTQKDESDPNDLSLLTFNRTYEQHVNGRRGSTKDIFYGQQRLRTITARGTYLRTISGTGGTFGNVFGTAATASANFLSATTGGYAFEVTVLAALATEEGGALTVGQDCELLTQPNTVTNEQNDRTDYAFVFQELIQQQSTRAAPYLDDPNIVDDKIMVGVSFSPLDDSPAPPPVSSIPGPGGSKAGAQQANPAAGGNGGGSTYSPPADPAKTTGVDKAGANPGTVSSSAIVPEKPVELLFHYEAYFNKTNVLDCYTYWNTNVLPLLLETLNNEFGLGMGSEMSILSEQTDRTKNKVSADGQVRAYNSNLINFIYVNGIKNELGVRADPAFTGTAHDYLVQQGLPRTTMTRRIEAIYKTGTFSLDQFVTPPALSGWVPLSNSQPSTKNVIRGIPSRGVPTQPLTYAVLEETLLWVRSNVAQGGGAAMSQGASSASAGSSGDGSPSGNQAPAPVSPGKATGVNYKALGTISFISDTNF